MKRRAARGYGLLVCRDVARLLEQPWTRLLHRLAATGQRIAEAVGKRFVKLQLELGGRTRLMSATMPTPLGAGNRSPTCHVHPGQAAVGERIYCTRRSTTSSSLLRKTVAGSHGDPTREDTYMAPSRRAPARRAGSAGGRLHPQGRPCWRAASGASAPATVRRHVLSTVDPHHGPDARESFGPVIGIHKCAATRAVRFDERHALCPDRRLVHTRRGACQRILRRCGRQRLLNCATA